MSAPRLSETRRYRRVMTEEEKSAGEGSVPVFWRLGARRGRHQWVSRAQVGLEDDVSRSKKEKSIKKEIARKEICGLYFRQ